MNNAFLKKLTLSLPLLLWLAGCSGTSGGGPVSSPTPPTGPATPSAGPVSPTTPPALPTPPIPPADPYEKAHEEYAAYLGTDVSGVKKSWDLLMTDPAGKMLTPDEITADRDKVGLFFTFVFGTDAALPKEIIKKEVQNAQFQYGLLLYTPKKTAGDFDKSLQALVNYNRAVKEEILKVAKIYKLKLRDFDLAADKGGILAAYGDDAKEFVNSMISPLEAKVGGVELVSPRGNANLLIENVTLIFQKKDGSEDLVSFATFTDPKLPPPGLWSMIYSFEEVFGKNCGGFTSLPPSAVSF